MSAPAGIEPMLFDPAETVGEFTGRFVDCTAGRSAEAVALAVWHLCDRAYRAGAADGMLAERELRSLTAQRELGAEPASRNE